MTKEVRMMYRRWGGWQFSETAERLSILDLVNSGTVDLRLASLLWLIMARRASVIVAAVPSQAGKTTTLNCLLDFLPPDIKQVELEGMAEDFGFLKHAGPPTTYLVAAEFSDHFDAYVWGDVARRAFELLGKGYGVGGTMHARTAGEALAILHEYLGVPLTLLAHLGLVVTLRVTAGRSYHDEPVRRVEAVSLVMPERNGFLLDVLASRGSGGKAFDFAAEDALQSAISRKFGIKDSAVAPEIEERERFLGQLLKEGKCSRDEVRAAIIQFYQSHRS